MSQTLITAENILFYVTVIAYFVSTACYFYYFAARSGRAAQIATTLITAGFVFHTLSLIVRGIGAGRVPLSNQFEFATAFAWGIALCYLLAYRKFRVSAMGTFIAPILFLIIGYAAMQSREVRDLMPEQLAGASCVHGDHFLRILCRILRDIAAVSVLRPSLGGAAERDAG